MTLFAENRERLLSRLRENPKLKDCSYVLLQGGEEVPFNDTDISWPFRQVRHVMYTYIHGHIIRLDTCALFHTVETNRYCVLMRGEENEWVYMCMCVIGFCVLEFRVEWIFGVENEAWSAQPGPPVVVLNFRVGNKRVENSSWVTGYVFCDFFFQFYEKKCLK